MTAAQELSANDKRILDAVDEVCTRLDGFIPHGIADWTGVRRLVKAGVIDTIGFARCENCEEHETLAFQRVGRELAK